MIAPQPVKDFEAWHAVHPQVQAHDIGPATGDGGERYGAVVCLGDVVPQSLDQIDEETTDLRIVIDHENATHRGTKLQ
jgi:hypothetical protein